VKAMFMTKIKSVLTVMLVVGLALGGIGAGVGHLMNPVAVAQTESPKQPPAKEENPTPPVATKKDEKPPHIVEKPDMKGLEVGTTDEGPEGCIVVVKSFFASMPLHHERRLREYFDPRYLKKHGLTDRDIAFEDSGSSSIHSLELADDNLTVLIVLNVKGGAYEAFVVRCVVYEGHVYISPEKAPDPKTGIFKPWILRTKVN
jgi:hypothetical protein